MLHADKKHIISRGQIFLPTESEFFDNRPVAVNVFVFNIIQKPATFSDHDQKPPAGMMIFFVNF